ncbi:AMP-binding protein [Williamsia sp. SKLECPSW1]
MQSSDHPATSHDVGPTEPPLIENTIGAVLDRTSDAHADRDALVEVMTGRRWTWSELRTAVDEVAAALLAEGVQKGDRVAIWAPNCAEWVLVQFATATVGAILVTVNPAYRLHELKYVLQQSTVRMVVATPTSGGSDYAAMLAAVTPEVPSVQRVVLIGTDGWSEFVAAGRDIDADAITEARDATSPDDPINIQYTSGTTGSPKGATLSHRNILNNGHFVGELCGYTEVDRVCIPVPFYHCFGMVMGNLACLTHGSTMVIPGPSFDPAATLAAVEAERCTSLYGVPTMFIAELGHPAFSEVDLSSLRTGIMAGSPCPMEIMKQVIDRMGMTEVSIAYGMTETSPVSLQTRVDDPVEKRVSTVGRVGPHLEVAIVDPATGERVPRGEPGELCTRGYSVMLGYWDNPEMTAQAIDPDGWMHTGDIGVMDADGYVAVTGRIKDMVIRGGENIYPREIEEFLYGHPDILDAQVVGIPDDRYGEELVACLRLRPGADDITAESLREFCRDGLARYKIPRYVQILDEFPMTVTGKVRKVELRERASKEVGTTRPSPAG